MNSLDVFDEMDTFFIDMETAYIEGAIAPISDFTFPIQEMKDAETIKPYALHGTLRTYSFSFREVLISVPICLAHLGRGHSPHDPRFIELVFIAPSEEGWQETFSEVYKLDSTGEEMLCRWIMLESNYVTHNWRKEGF